MRSHVLFRDVLDLLSSSTAALRYVSDRRRSLPYCKATTSVFVLSFSELQFQLFGGLAGQKYRQTILEDLGTLLDAALTVDFVANLYFFTSQFLEPQVSCRTALREIHRLAYRETSP